MLLFLCCLFSSPPFFFLFKKVWYFMHLQLLLKRKKFTTTLQLQFTVSVLADCLFAVYSSLLTKCVTITNWGQLPRLLTTVPIIMGPYFVYDWTAQRLFEVTTIVVSAHASRLSHIWMVWIRTYYASDALQDFSSSKKKYSYRF